MTQRTRHLTLTLAELLPSLAYCAREYPSGAVSYPDAGWRSEAQRALLWQLKDYRVSSVSGGTVWLCPVDGGQPWQEGDGTKGVWLQDARRAG